MLTHLRSLYHVQDRHMIDIRRSSIMSKAHLMHFVKSHLQAKYFSLLYHQTCIFPTHSQDYHKKTEKKPYLSASFLFLCSDRIQDSLYYYFHHYFPSIRLLLNLGRITDARSATRKFPSKSLNGIPQILQIQ